MAEAKRTCVDIGKEIAIKYGVDQHAPLCMALCEAALEGYALANREARARVNEVLDKWVAR